MFANLVTSFPESATMSSNSPFRSGYVSGLLAALCAVLLVPGGTFASSALSDRQTNMQAPAPVDQSARIPSDQLDSLVAPIALYPDPLLAQTLAASTYPLEVLQLQQWLAKNPGLKDKALLDAVAKQPWDPSVQALAPLPDVVTRLAHDIQWTTDLGNAFLAQETDVMNAVQRMREKAQAKGNLVSTPQQTVETQVVDSKPVIVIEQANPEVVYVPSYNPSYVYGAPVYPYPPIYYPSYSWFPGAGALAWGTGVAMGAAWGGGWGWGANWGDADISFNRNNYFNRNANISGVGNRWQHNVAHRGGTPYRDQATANRFGGTARGESLAARQAGARQQVQRQGGNLRSGAVGTAGAGNRAAAAGLGERAGQGGLSGRAGQGALADRAGQGGLAGRAGQGALGDRAGQGGLSGRAGQGTLGNRPSQLPSQGGIGSRAGQGGLSTRPSQGGLSSRPSGSHSISGRDLSSRGSSGSAFGGGSFSGSGARASSSRGSSSMRSSGSRGSGGFSRGGGSRGGGFSRGGGGGRSRGGGRR
jgi:hypothetical protein